jgi:CheY-like chemotaxis protein
VTRQYRATETKAHRALILATTADISVTNREECAEAGMDGFIGKPLTPEKISVVLREYEKQSRETDRKGEPIYIEDEKAGDTPDLSLLQFLSNVAEGGISTQIDRFLENLAIDRQKAYDIATGGDTKHLSQVAHRLVSHADAIRYEPLRRVAISIHAEAAILDPATLTDRLKRFDNELAALTKKLGSFRVSTVPS